MADAAKAVQDDGRSPRGSAWGSRPRDHARVAEGRLFGRSIAERRRATRTPSTRRSTLRELRLRAWRTALGSLAISARSRSEYLARMAPRALVSSWFAHQPRLNRISKLRCEVRSTSRRHPAWRAIADTDALKIERWAWLLAAAEVRNGPSGVDRTRLAADLWNGSSTSELNADPFRLSHRTARWAGVFVRPWDRLSNGSLARLNRLPLRETSAVAHLGDRAACGDEEHCAARLQTARPLR